MACATRGEDSSQPVRFAAVSVASTCIRTYISERERERESKREKETTYIRFAAVSVASTCIRTYIHTDIHTYTSQPVRFAAVSVAST